MAKREIPEINAGSMADIAFLLLIFFLVTTTMEKEKAMVRMLPKKSDAPPPMVPDVVNERDLLEVYADDKGNLLVRGKVMQIPELKQFTLDFYQTNKETPITQMGVMTGENSELGRSFPYYQKWDIPYLESKIEEVNQSIQTLNDNIAKGEVGENDEAFLEYYYLQLKYYKKRIDVCEEIGPFRTINDRIIIRVINSSRTKYEHYLNVQDQIQSAIDELRDAECKRLWNTTYEKVKRALNETTKPKALEVAIVRKGILEMLVPGKVVEKSENR